MRREKKIIIQKWGKKSSKYLLLHWKCEVLPDSVQQVGCQFFLFLLSILLIVETLMSLPLRVDCVYLFLFFFCVCCLWNWIETYDVWPPSSICTIWCGFIYRNNLTVYFVFVSVWIFFLAFTIKFTTHIYFNRVTGFLRKKNGRLNVSYYGFVIVSCFI